MFAESPSINFFSIGVAGNIFNPQPLLLGTLSYYDVEDICFYFRLHYNNVSFVLLRLKMLNTPCHSVQFPPLSVEKIFFKNLFYTTTCWQNSEIYVFLESKPFLHRGQLRKNSLLLKMWGFFFKWGNAISALKYSNDIFLFRKSCV